MPGFHTSVTLKEAFTTAEVPKGNISAMGKVGSFTCNLRVFSSVHCRWGLEGGGGKTLYPICSLCP